MAVATWKQVAAGGQVPGPRSGAASVIVPDLDNPGSASMYLFGGYGGQGRLADFHRFSFDTRTWSEVPVEGESPGVRENNGIVLYPDPADPPTPHATTPPSLFLFGGYNGSAWLADHWLFDIASSTWRRVVPNGALPAARFGYVSVVYRTHFYLFGGYNGQEWLADLHSLDLETMTWAPVHATGSVPSIRSCPSWCKHRDSVYVFGGYDGVQRMNDFYSFNLGTHVWTRIEMTGDVPSPRYFHSSVVYGNASTFTLYSFGGYNGQARLNDMHQFDFSTKRWSLVETAGDLPSGRSSLVAEVYGSSLFIFGGYNGQVVLNDFFEYRLAPIVIPPPTLVEDLRGLINNEEMSDVTFEVEGELVHANRAILGARSEHFRAMLFGHMRESRAHGPDGAPTPIPIVDVSRPVFLALLEFLYTDTIAEDSVQPDIAVPLLIASEQYLLDRLKSLTEDIIRTSINTDNVVGILCAAARHNATGLKEITLEYILDHLETVKTGPAFQELKQEPELLMELIMRQSGM